MVSCWRNFHHWLYLMSKLQLPVQPVMKISSKMTTFAFQRGQVWQASQVKLASYDVRWKVILMFEFALGGWGKANIPLKTLRPRQNGHHFPDDIFNWIFLNENVWISINISLKFSPRDPINNIPTLVQVMAWRRPGDKPLSEPMMVRLPTHICVTPPQCASTGLIPDPCGQHRSGSSPDFYGILQSGGIVIVNERYVVEKELHKTSNVGSKTEVKTKHSYRNIDGLEQDCSNSSALAIELPTAVLHRAINICMCRRNDTLCFITVTSYELEIIDNPTVCSTTNSRESRDFRITGLL